MSVLDLFLFLTGLALLVVGAEFLVRGATRLGRLAGISPLVVGLTLVSFATTTPEVSISIAASSQGRSGLVLGNLLGTNTFNIMVVIGAAAVVRALSINKMAVRKDVPVLIAATILAYLMCLDGVVAIWEGVILVTALVIFVTYSVYSSRREARATRVSRITRARRAALLDMGAGIVLAGGGGVMIIFGAGIFVDSAAAMASALGVSELIIGLTVVAAGTSAPELTTSLVAAYRRESELAMGNAIGASIINILGITGLSALVAKGRLEAPEDAIRLDFPVTLTVAIVFMAFILTGRRITRTEGMIMLAFYLVYVIVLISVSLNASLLGPVSKVMLMFVLPVSVLAVAVAVWNSVRDPVGRRLEPPFVDR